jgi:hypothetical protein
LFFELPGHDLARRRAGRQGDKDRKPFEGALP